MKCFSLNILLGFIAMCLVLTIATPLPVTTTDISKRAPTDLVARLGIPPDLIAPPYCRPDPGKCQLMVQRWAGNGDAVLSLWDSYCNVIGYNNHVNFGGPGPNGFASDTFGLDSELPWVTVVTTTSAIDANVQVDYSFQRVWTVGSWPNAGGIYNLCLFDC